MLVTTGEEPKKQSQNQHLYAHNAKSYTACKRLKATCCDI